MSEQEIDQLGLQEAKRPTFLKVLCILSFISIGFSTISSVGSLIGGPEDKEAMIEQKAEMMEATSELRENGMNALAEIMEQIQRMSESLNDHFYAMTLVSLLIVIIGFFGVFFMWKGKRIGFHLYIVYNLVGLGNLYLFVSPSDVPTFAVIWSLLLSTVFILLYSRNLHWMK
jgi:uncharacterized membrane protein (DUF106 family)